MSHDFDALQVPAFARLHDYLGLWMLEESAAAGMYQLAGQINLKAHVEAGAEPLKSAMEKVGGTGGGKSVAVVRLQGLLMKGASSMGGTSTVQARRDLRQAVADDSVGGILLAIDSPGGTVAGTDDLAAEVRTARQSKPVYAHIDDLGASAAYWIASQAERVSVNSPTALVGSIGTLQVLRDVSAAAQKQGVRTLVFGTGPFKGLGTPGSAITDDQAAHVQQLVNSVQTSFDAAVKAGRGMNDEQLAAVRHGGVFHAQDALRRRLVDAVQPLSKTLDELTRRMQSGVPPARSAGFADVETGIDLATGELVAFVHNSDTSPQEPDWGSVDKTALPMLAFADHGDGPQKKSSWSYPHHWVKDAGGKDANGVWTTGTLLLHKGGLNAAWSAAQGGRSGQKASNQVIDHLQAHRRALGLGDKQKSEFESGGRAAVASLPMIRRTLPTTGPRN